MSESRENDLGEGFMAKGRTWKKNNGRRGQSRSKFRGTTNVSSIRKNDTMWKIVQIVKEKKKKTSNSSDVVVVEEN